MMLQGARVLILEDEPITALDLASTVEAAGGVVIGPVATVAAALALLERHKASAAILDAKLPDGDMTPVAIFLLERGVPVIVHTGTGLPDDLRQRYPDVHVIMKPTQPDGVIEALAAIIGSGDGEGR